MTIPTIRAAESRGSRRGLWPLALLLALAALWPASAGAETRTFVNFDWLFPSEGAGTGGPANTFPSTISVAGLAGTLTAVKVTTAPLRSTSPDDLDMALTGPNGQSVMLMSDTCGENPTTTEDQYFTFDDAAPGFLSNNGPCANHQRASYRPSNYLGTIGPEPEDFSNLGGPEEFVNNLAALAGGSPNGDWKLWLVDDNPLGYNGFGLGAWVLTLEITPPPPPPPPPPTIVTVQVPAPPPAKTGRRARAMAKCKSKPNAEAKKRCRNNAKKLPV